MARNVEIKASVRSLEGMHERLIGMADSGPDHIEQDDTFFMCDSGRLKLREFSDGRGELIFYRRTGAEGPRTCDYEIAPVEEAGPLRSVLGKAYRQVGRVRKIRTLYMVGRTRVHVDRVEGLGTFMELEVVLGDGESEEAGIREARDLMAALGIEDSALIERAYVDLLEGKDARTPRR